MKTNGAGGAYVTGWFAATATFGSTSLTASGGNYYLFVARIDGTGIFTWAVKVDGSANDRGHGIASDGAGGACVTGYFVGSAAFGSASRRARPRPERGPGALRAQGRALVGVPRQPARCKE